MWIEPKVLRYLREKPEWILNGPVLFQLTSIKSSKQNLELQVKLDSEDVRYQLDVEEAILEHFKHVLGTYFRYHKRLRIIV
jgi:hypothetical protein